jgi:hypothetical protein
MLIIQDFLLTVAVQIHFAFRSFRADVVRVAHSADVDAFRFVVASIAPVNKNEF